MTTPSGGWSAEQLANANTIIQVGNQLGASQRDITIALMTAMQESNLININYGDQAGPDSLGLFQQRAPWGSAAARMDPASAARMFFEGGQGGQPGLFSFSDRNSLSLTAAAQAVQVSAFPTAYAKWQGAAEGILGQAAGSASAPAQYGPAPTIGPRVGGSQVSANTLASAGLNSVNTENPDNSGQVLGESVLGAPTDTTPTLQAGSPAAESQAQAKALQTESNSLNSQEQSTLAGEKTVTGSEQSTLDAGASQTGAQSATPGQAVSSPTAMQQAADSQFLRPMTLTEFTQQMGGQSLTSNTPASNVAGVSQVSGNRQTMLQKALAQVGTPYMWGGSAPGGFDCSGLVQWAYSQIGVNLPRISFQQADAGQRVALNQLQPGDLVAMDESNRNGNANADHIAIYLGNNQLLEAPAPGEPVRVRALSPWDEANAWGVSMQSFFNNPSGGASG